MISFGQLISANLSRAEDPDYLITINGENVNEWVREWELVDDEQGMSEITITLANPEMTNAGKWDYGQDLEIRFGYVGELSGRGYLPVTEVTERYPQGMDSTIVVVGRDESQKMSGGKHKGNHGGKDDLALLRKDGEAHGLKIVSGDGVKGAPNKKGSVYNENSYQLAQRCGKGCTASSGGGSGGKSPTNPLSKEKSGGVPGQDAKRDQAQCFSSAERVPEDGEGRDGNRADNHQNAAQQAPITARLVLRGFPSLRAKATVGVTGAGSKASGTYYVKKAVHNMQGQNGYLTTADLARGGSGEGGVGGSPPMVMYADIWQRGNIYLGPRKSNEEPQATFDITNSRHVVSFEYKMAPQSQRHGGEDTDSKGEGIDLRKKGEAYITNKLGGDTGGGSGGGGNTGLPGGSAGPGSP